MCMESICHWDYMLKIDFFKGVKFPNFNPFKFSRCVLLFRQSCHVIVDTDKRQRLYLLEVAA